MELYTFCIQVHSLFTGKRLHPSDSRHKGNYHYVRLVCSNDCRQKILNVKMEHTNEIKAFKYWDLPKLSKSTRQLIELESYSNPLNRREEFQIRSTNFGKCWISGLCG